MVVGGGYTSQGYRINGVVEVPASMGVVVIVEVSRFPSCLPSLGYPDGSPNPSSCSLVVNLSPSVGFEQYARGWTQIPESLRAQRTFLSDNPGGARSISGVGRIDSGMEMLTVEGRR